MVHIRIALFSDLEHKVYYTLNEALNAALIDDKKVVFSKEIKRQGKRLFIVCTKNHFWQFYQQLADHDRKYYEIITNCQTKLYFDIEYDMVVNKEKNGPELVEKLIKIVANLLSKKYDLLCSIEDVLILDSTTKEKFSFHLIFPKVIFSNNRCCKDFITYLVGNLSNEDLNMLTVFDSHKNKKLIIDLSVYSKNQNFRILFSSKYGKSYPLQVSQSNKYVISNEKAVNIQSQFFFDSLVCGKDFIVNTLSSDKIDASTEATYDVKSLPHEDENLLTSAISSKLPEIERFLKSLIKTGKISKVRFYENQETSKSMIIFEISNFRYCHNIQKEHKGPFIVDVSILHRPLLSSPPIGL